MRTTFTPERRVCAECGEDFTARAREVVEHANMHDINRKIAGGDFALETLTPCGFPATRRQRVRAAHCGCKFARLAIGARGNDVVAGGVA